MRKLFILLSLFGITQFSFAQKNYNRWSLEANAGFNKAMGPLTANYYSPTLNVGHADFGLRYMFNEYFGVKGNFGFGSFTEAKNKSPEFKANYLNTSFQGVVNIGRVLNFESFTKKFGLLGSFGPGFGFLKHEDRIIPDFDPDYLYSINTGIDLIYKLSERVSLQGNTSVIVNGRQRYTFDGNDFNSPGRPEAPEIPYVHAMGTWWKGTLGLNFYLGSKEQHADWYLASEKYATKEELAAQITGIKDMLKDSDEDGVPDYLDKEPHTPVGARVSSSGITLDSDNDGTPDHLDKCPFLPGPANTNGCPVEEIIEQVDYLRKAINDNYLNVYFAFDSSKPLDYSISSTQFISNFLKKNPGVLVEIKGYADEIGPEDYNMKLSEKRAKAVYDLLIASGINPSRLSFKGYGEDTSVDKTSEGARQMSRRTSFEVK